MRPRILACLPKAQRDWVDLRAQQGVTDQSNTLLFYMFKVFSPGSPDEKDALLLRVLNPSVCTHAASAQIELMRWHADVLRLESLGCFPPDLMLSYRAIESILRGGADERERETRKDKRLSPVYNAQVL